MSASSAGGIGRWSSTGPSGGGVEAVAGVTVPAAGAGSAHEAGAPRVSITARAATSATGALLIAGASSGRRAVRGRNAFHPATDPMARCPRLLDRQHRDEAWLGLLSVMESLRFRHGSATE